MTDNRTNEPTEAQAELARRALNEHRALAHVRCACGWPGVGNVTTSIGLGRHQAWEALVAAHGAAPQAESEDNVMCRCGHGTGSHDFSDPQEPCREIVCDCRGWFGVSPVLPSSG